MIRNYFKIAWRNLLRNKVFSVINIVGLTTGLVCCLLLVLYIQHELSFDNFHPNKDRIVRVIMEYSFNGNKPVKGNWTSTKVLPAFERQFPEVESGVRMNTFWTSNVVKYGDKLFIESNFLFADSNFFNVFGYKLISGNPSQVLKLTNNVVITETSAKKYFGEDNPVGKTLLIGTRQMPFLVTGVAKDCPDNSQLKFDFIASFSSLGENQEQTYFNANYTTYLLLKDKNSIASLQKKIEPFMKKEMKNEKGTYINYYLEPLTQVHLYSPYDAMVPNTNIVYIYIISGVALLILLIACFTYINLSTVKSIGRAKEVGIRKVAGANKKQIFWQFIIESLVITLTSVIISIAITIFILPLFNSFTQKNLTVFNLLNPSIIASVLILLFTIAVLAGSYPAMIVAAFKPVKVLKGAFKNTAPGNWLRKSLIVFQFSISVFLIIAAIIIARQLSFIQNKKLGYDKEHVLVTHLTQTLVDKIDLVKSEFKSNPDIISVSKTAWEPVSIISGGHIRRADLPPSNNMNVSFSPVDEDYVKTCGLQLIAGNELSRQDILDGSKDSNNYNHIIINEAACKALGWKSPQEAINKKIFFGDGPGEIKGVVKDFHFASLHSLIEPLVLSSANWGNTLLIKTSGKNLPQTIDFIGKKYKAIEPNLPFDFHFMDEDFQKLYTSEMRTGKVFNLFTFIAVLLACLGLFGLAAYDIRQRTKEIGVRKVLGASVSQITILLSGGFLKLVLAGIVIASPIAWWLSNKWLLNFAYRINISWWMFLLAGLLALLIALITISYQSIKASIANPVKSLRTE
ncbi:MAG: ABC transporter permease [Lentimicrobiaceae bacterium]|jgi:putative ABC transport system permease protein